MSLSAGLLLLLFNADVYKQEYGCQGILASNSSDTPGGQPRSTQIALALYQLFFALIAEVRKFQKQMGLKFFGFTFKTFHKYSLNNNRFQV